MFIDEAQIEIRSGHGGDGCVSMRREKYIPKGGPDGGDGGRGGDIIIIADSNISTLLDYRNRRHWHAKNGLPGMGKEMTGASANDLILKVPPGTLVFDDDSGELIVDIDQDNMQIVVAEGGKGGFGNTHYKSAINQTPRDSTPGGPSVEMKLRLELKLMADVGLVGLPNAGKSTLLCAISKARPMVANFPFTTLRPQLGIVHLDADRNMIFADIPGLIKGAAEGAGLGHDFLKHIERTRILIHLVDILPMDESDPVENYHTIRRELTDYSTKLAEKTEIIVLNKVDLVQEGEEREQLIEKIAGRLGYGKGERPMILSGATGLGQKQLLEACWDQTQRKPNTWAAQAADADENNA